VPFDYYTISASGSKFVGDDVRIVHANVDANKVDSYSNTFIKNDSTVLERVVLTMNDKNVDVDLNLRVNG
jgi:hypothetical protein